MEDLSENSRGSELSLQAWESQGGEGVVTHEVS